MAVFWAIILAILFHKRFDKIKAKMPKKPSLAAGLTLGYMLIFVIVPLVIVTIAVIYEANVILGKMSQDNISIQEEFNNLQRRISIPDHVLAKLGLTAEDIERKIYELFSSAARLVTGYAIGVTKNIFNLLINFFLMLYIFFFFIRDGKKLVDNLVWAIPMNDHMERNLLSRFESVARATVKGSLIVAFVQGTIGGLLFWILGIKGAFLWGVMMVLASLLPIGSALIWVPWAIILIIQGEIGRSIILVAVGIGFIGLIDNFLRPRLVGKDTKLPDYLVLLSTLGGLAWFGLSGFVIGPVVAALFVTCWQMMGKKYGNTPREKPQNKELLNPNQKVL